MKKSLVILISFVALMGFLSQSSISAEHGIKAVRVHPKFIKPGDEITVNVLLKGDFTAENPIVAVFIKGEKVADNSEMANKPVSIAPAVSLKFAADNKFANHNTPIEIVMNYQGERHSFTYYPDSQYKDFNADAPWRVLGSNASVPVEAMIRDGDTWSCNLDWVKVADVNNNYNTVAYYDAGGMDIDMPRWSHIFDGLTVNDFTIVDGHIDIRVKMHYREMLIFPYDFEQFLRVKVATEPFPKIAGWYYGDTHYHTSFTDNYYEEGGTFGMISRCGMAMGLDWTATTDHASNNSGDQFPMGEFANDLEEDEWNPLGDSCAYYKTDNFKIIRGEEITVKNDAVIPDDDGPNDNTAHMLSIGNTDYIEGPVGPDAYFEDGDHSNLKSLTSRLELLENMPQGIAIAAHPTDTWLVPVYEDIIPWGTAMYDTGLSSFSRFVGLEFYNERNFYFTDNSDYINPDVYVNPFPVWQPQADWDSNFVKGLDVWDSLLCANLNPIRKVFAYGGSDAHGDFNYHYYGLTLLFYSSIGVTDNAFAKARTCVYCPDGMGENGENVLDALKNGVCVVTDGPFLIFGIDADGDGSVFGPYDAIIGGTAAPPSAGANPKLVCYWKSTPEFGPIEYMKLIVGTPSGTTEYTQSVNNYSGYVSIDITPYIPQGENRFYYRLEAYCPQIDGYPGYRAITNPIWVDLTSRDRNDTPHQMSKTDLIMDNYLFFGSGK